MASFEKAVTFTLGHEGGFSDDAADSGGATHFGITNGTLAEYQRKTGKLAGRKIGDLTRREAIEIYRAFYWRYDEVNSDIIATKLFDIGVNMGLGAAVKIVQQAINFIAKADRIEVDGKWGPRTLMFVNMITVVRTAESDLYKAMTLFQVKRYVDIVIGNPSQLVFIQGWLTRGATKPT